MTSTEQPSTADKGRKLAKWLDFMFSGPQIGDQVRVLCDEIDRMAAQVATAEQRGREEGQPDEWPPHWANYEKLSDLHALYHGQTGNMLGKAECGWERCDFWETAEFTLDASAVLAGYQWGRRDALASVEDVIKDRQGIGSEAVRIIRDLAALDREMSRARAGEVDTDD
jgi:hypothetical protein